jgi:AraC-like DNA-binding protein
MYNPSRNSVEERSRLANEFGAGRFCGTTKREAVPTNGRVPSYTHQAKYRLCKRQAGKNSTPKNAQFEKGFTSYKDHRDYDTVELGKLRNKLLYRWSADQVDPKHRFDEWREVRSRGLFGVTAELEPEQRETFTGEFTLQKFGEVGLVELKASAYQVTRTTRDISDAPSDSLCIYEQLSDGGRFDTADGSDFAVRRGTFATSYANLPYRTSPTGADGFHLRIVKIPVSEIWMTDGGLRDLFPKPFTGDPVIAPLLRSCFADLVSTGECMEPEAAVRLIRALASLALIERGTINPGSEFARKALRVGRLSLAQRIIASQSSDPNLSPASVAAQLGVSIRHLHALFERTAMSFSQTLTAARIEHSRKLLVGAPGRAISSIAFASGFDSIATFYRVFRATSGMAPGDFREAAADGATAISAAK